MAYAVAAPYAQAIRDSGPRLTYVTDATLGGVAIEGATGLLAEGGSIADTSAPGVRRTLSLSLASPLNKDLYELLSGFGTRLTVTCRVEYTNGDSVDVPMGVFVVNRQQMAEGPGLVQLTAPDKWFLIQKANFIRPQKSTRNALVTDQIATLIRGALGESEPVVNLSTSTATVGTLTWDKDRARAILDLARDAAVWVYFDRNGTATIADVPTIGATANWTVDAGSSGVLVSLDREQSREDTFNVVVIDSSHADGEKFTPQVVWDDDPDSPTYAGTDPVTAPETAGPLGIVPTFHSSAVLTTSGAAIVAGRAMLARTVGRASQVSLGSVPNPAIDAFDIVDVLPPRERYDVERTAERHIVDTVTHPFTVASAQQIEGRSIRAEEYAP